MIPSNYQTKIYEHIQNDQGNAVVEAVAGSGKTTTIVEALNLLPKYTKTLFVAFNKHIATELQKRVPYNVEASTLNATGFRIFRERFRRCRIKETKTIDILWFEVLQQSDRNIYYKIRGPVKQLVALFKAYEIKEPTQSDITYLTSHFDIMCEEDNWENYAIETLRKSNEQTFTIDFDDQLYLPLILDLPFPSYDYVFVDEAQDLSPVQISLVHKLGKTIIAVGDSRQAIYGFRGAAPDAIDNIIQRLSATTLPLSICNRCAKNVVLEAKKIVPHIEYADTAEDGIVARRNTAFFDKTVGEGDYVLCRTMAPLVKDALLKIRNRQKAIVRGREIGENLLSLLDHVTDLDSYEQQMCEKLKNKESELLAFTDRIDTFRALLDAYGEKGLEAGINELFSNEAKGIIYSTIHRSKGLETDRVFLLCPELLPHPKCTSDWQRQQEENLHYIALTRAKKEFYYVDPKATQEGIDDAICTTGSGDCVFEECGSNTGTS